MIQSLLSPPRWGYFERTGGQTCASACIHQKQGVQTLRVLGRCIGCWELVTWVLNSISHGCLSLDRQDANGLALGNTCLRSQFCPNTYLVNIIWWIIYSHCLIPRTACGNEHYHTKIWFNEVSRYCHVIWSQYMLTGFKAWLQLTQLNLGSLIHASRFVLTRQTV